MSGACRRFAAVAATVAVVTLVPSSVSPAGAVAVETPAPVIAAVELASPGVPGERSWWPVDINERGQVLGMSGATRHPLVPGTPVLWDGGGVPRQIVPDGRKGSAVDLSDRGQAVGTIGSIEGTGGGAFSWLDGTFTQVSSVGEAIAVNERGDVLHQAHTLSTAPYPTPSPPLVWRDGETVEPAPIGWGFSYLRGKAISDRGQVAFDLCWGCGSESPVLLRTPAIWQVGGGITGAGPWGAMVVDINESGAVAGNLGVEGAASGTRATLWRDGSVIDLGTLGGTSSVAQAVNDRGHVMGRITAVTGDFRAFLWRDGRMTDLGTLGSGSSTSVSPMALNERDQVVGCSQVPTADSQHAFLWQDGRMLDLHTALPDGLGDGWSCALALNERGEIVGMFQGEDGTTRAIKWTVRP